MDAIDMLKKQHREVEGLFQEFSKAESAGTRRNVFDKIADALAIHATIEERHFYPSVKERATEEILLASVEEHLEIKRTIADLLALDADDEGFEAQVMTLQEEVQQHVEEEETDLFPKVKGLFDEEKLEEIAAAMEETQNELIERGSPRNAVPSETEQPAQI
jgi:hemerythrin superfamily protein